MVLENIYIQKTQPTFIIIGLGVSGLTCARHCIRNNYNIIILEKNKNLGGVWYNKTYPDVKLQTTKESYAFSDFSFYNNISLYPSGNEVLDYLEDYANYHNILQYTKFNSKVIQTNFNYENEKWNVEYMLNNKKHVVKGDYLLIASGFYSDKLNTSSLLENNSLINNKKILSIKDFNNTKLNYNIFKDKNICIIGNGPTGCDLTCLLHKYSPKNIKLLYRSERWLFRRYLWNKLSTDKLLCRLFMKIAIKLPKFIYLVLIIISYYIIYIFSHGFFSFKIKSPLEPVTRKNLVLNENIIKYITNNNIEYIKSKNIKIDNNYIHYNNNKITYDYCIIATGYISDIEFLNMKNIPKLYNKIIHPEIPNCGFIGFSPSFNWVQVSELQIQWYLEYLKQNIKNISKDEMYKDISFKIKNLSNKSYDYHDLSINAFDYCDSLAKDIKINLKYSKFNPKYWFNSPEHDLWSYKN